MKGLITVFFLSFFLAACFPEVEVEGTAEEVSNKWGEGEWDTMKWGD